MIDIKLILPIFLILGSNVFIQFTRRSRSHLKYLKLVFPKEFTGIDFTQVMITGTFYKAPQLLFPYVRKFPNLNSEQLAAYFTVRKRIIFEILSIVGLILFFVMLVVYSKLKFNAI